MIILIVIDNDDDIKALIKPALTVIRQLREIFDVQHITISCCVNSCLTFIVDYENLNECSFYNESRFDQRKHSCQTFDYILITHQLRLQFANFKRVTQLQDYRKSLISTS